MKIYIAGKYTGLPHHEAVEKFNRTRHELVKKGVPEEDIIIPTDHVPEGTTWHKAMEMLLPVLHQCSAILMLHDWVSSKGSWIEYNTACNRRMDVFFESEGGINTIADLIACGV